MEKLISNKVISKRKAIAAIVMISTWLLLLAVSQLTVQAAPQYGFGRNDGRIAPVNVNDYHTSQWDRFHNNYQFRSGMDYRYDLGRPSTFDGFVPVDLQTANFRRDANVSLRPPSYGTFSGNFATDPTNRFFQQPQNPSFRVNQLGSTTFDPRFDTLGQGVNAPSVGNPINMHNIGTPGQLPNTSVGGNGIVPQGANNMTGNWFENNGSVFNQSANNSSNVTIQSPEGFLPPTSIGVESRP